MKKWIIYNPTIVFAVYWFSNLFLWFPWSLNTNLGIILMLTVSPFFWGYSSYKCLVSFPENNLIKGASVNALLFLLIAIVFDFIFFGIVRNAMSQLYHPTTFYGYIFIVVLPFMVVLFFKNRIKQSVKNKLNFKNPLFLGLISFVFLCLIIRLKIEL